MAVLALAAALFDSAAISAEVPPNCDCCKNREASADVGGLIVMLGGGGGAVNVCEPTTLMNVPFNSPAGLAAVLITIYELLLVIVCTMLAAWLTLKIHLSEPSGCKSPWARPTGTSYMI